MSKYPLPVMKRKRIKGITMRAILEMFFRPPVVYGTNRESQYSGCQKEGGVEGVRKDIYNAMNLRKGANAHENS